MYKSIWDILQENGYGSEWFSFASYLQSWRNGDIDRNIAVLIILEARFDIITDIDALDDLSDEQLREKRAKTAKLLENKEKKSFVKEFGIRYNKFETKRVDGLIIQNKTPSAIKNMKLAKYNERVGKRVESFDTVRDVWTYYYSVKKSSFVIEVVKRALEKLINQEQSDILKPITQFWLKLISWEELVTKCDEFKCFNDANMHVTEQIYPQN